MSGRINVLLEDGQLAFCKVVENLGYNHDAGAYCKIVKHEGHEILVKRQSGSKLWRPHTARERVQPLIDHFARLKREQHERNGPADYAGAGREPVATDQCAEANTPATPISSKER